MENGKRDNQQHCNCEPIVSRNVYMRKCISLMKFAAEGNRCASVKEVKPTRELEETYMYEGKSVQYRAENGNS